MKKVIHHHEISPIAETTIKLVEGAKILSVCFPPHYGIILAVMTDFFETKEENAKAIRVERLFKCFSAGTEIPEGWKFLGSVFDNNRNIGYHVHEFVLDPDPSIYPESKKDGKKK